ncbi:MAG: transposase [Kiritimatiellae bacterium]|nr:transposase [Kiritimatiellia bacterium]
MLIIDAQSGKNTDPAEKKGYDGGKKMSEIKRHLAADSWGRPHQLHVTTANISDKARAREMISKKANSYNDSDGSKVEKVLVDGGYTGAPFSKVVKEQLGAEVEVAKRNGLHTFAVTPKRCVVERSIS